MIRDNINPLMTSSDTDITPERFISFFTSTPEDKSFSPSGLHLGHYKAAVTNKTMAKVLWNILSTALKYSLCLDRWKQSARTLIEKLPGLPRIHKFRTIHLIKSYLNFIMRYIWGKQFMQYNETSNTFHDNQYGGRKGRQPQSAVLNKLLSLDVTRYLWRTCGSDR